MSAQGCFMIRYLKAMLLGFASWRGLIAGPSCYRSSAMRAGYSLTSSPSTSYSSAEASVFGLHSARKSSLKDYF